MNEDRTSRIAAMLADYAEQVGDPNGEYFSIISDVLTDLRHYCADNAIPLDRAWVLSQDNYEEESEEAEAI
jgi:hypothetical protein